ncbi:MAG: N-acetyl-gamma-glutamyl-phosphate reductase [Pirellulaceae bacterium]|nr:N-acetyl-gamma-glutamyl-phosphate reductase [Pirellulaceae bacterium]
MKIRVGIVGATGYTAFELFKILLRHPHVSITRATSRADAGQPLEMVHPSLRGVLPLSLSEFSAADFSGAVDLAFCCLPHAASSVVVKELLNAGIKTIDLSADYRLNDLASFSENYQADHADPERLGKVPYGIPELFRDEIAASDLVANPGCFPTTAIIPLVPLIESNLLDPIPIIVDSKTGVSGGGRTPKLAFHYPECNESVTAYAVGTHRHRPEMEQIVERVTQQPIKVNFVPHLLPMDRGILSTIYVQPKTRIKAADLLEAIRARYVNETFIRVTNQLPATKDVSGTNFCDITTRDLNGQVVVLCAIDNLLKGASGAAVQNMNVMYGWPETTALI